MADLLAFIDIQTQAPKQTNSISNNNNSSSEPGVFDSLMNEYKAQENFAVDSENPKTDSPETNLVAFKGSKLFSGSVIEILADSPETLAMPEELLNVVDETQSLVDELKISLGKVRDSQPEVLYEDDEINLNEEISQLLNLSDEELNEKLASLPGDLRDEIKNLLDEINKALESGGDLIAVKSSVEKLSDILNKKKLEAANDDKKILIDDHNDDDDDEAQEPELISVEAAGLVAANVENDKIADSDSNAEPEKNLVVRNLDGREGTKLLSMDQVSQSENEIEAEPDVEAQANPEQKFRDLLRARQEERANSQNENEPDFENQNQDPNFGQARDNFSGSRNQSRSRNDSRRVASSNSRDEERTSSSATSRTESRNDFQSFFEGVLNSRRATGTSTASSQPLNLRGSYNLNQSETLRNGLVNVVRFIRSDGVQKASVVIDPPALGRISVELTSSTSGVEASIKVASEQIRQLVQDQLTQLRMNLSEQGVQVAEFTVDVQQDNQQGSSQGENQQDRRENFIAGLENEDDTEEFRVDLEEGLLYWVA